MKKLLLLILGLGSFVASAQQVFWDEYSTGFLNVSTSQGQISYAPGLGGDVVWTYATAGDGSGDFYQTWGRSLDGGATWTSGTINVGNTSLAIGSIHAVSSTTAYVAVFPNAATVQGGIWRTTDSGVTWTKQATASFNTGTDSFTNWIYFWDANNGVCMGDPAGGYFEIYTTTNGGTNWNRTVSANIPAPLDGEYGYTHNFEVNGDRLWFGTNKGRLIRSDDHGLSWGTVGFQTPIADFGSAAISGNYAFKDASNGLLISSDWQFFRTTDGGATWNSEFPGGQYYRNFDVAYIPGTDNTYVTTGQDIDSGVNRGSSYSLDGGLNWVDITDSSNALFDVNPVDGGGALEFYDYTHGLASGFTASSTSGGVWKWLAPTLATADFQSTNAFTASPNPTTGALTIAGKNISNVAVYDILGKQVSNANFSSLSTANINIASLNAGVYMVKVTNNEGAASTIKVVKQ